MLGDLAKDTTEVDLWAFEDDLEDLEATPPTEPGRSQAGNIPAPREQAPTAKRSSDKPSGLAPPEDGGNRIRMNINKPRVKGRSPDALSGQSKPESDFDDLEEWDDVPGNQPPVVEELPSADVLAAALPPSEPQVPATPEAEPEPAVAIVETVVPEPTADEFSPAMKKDAAPVALRPHLGLNHVERIGLVSLLVILLGGAVWFLATTVFRLPKPVVRLEARDFPIQGEKFRVDSAECYWRTPITEGAQADVCRRGTLLLPVIEMATSGGSSLVRVFFKDDEGNTIGDPILRAVGGGTVKVAATAGIEDAGVFAAYRTGNHARWTAQVFEIPSGDVAKGESRKLFEVEIPAVRR